MKPVREVFAAWRRVIEQADDRDLMKLRVHRNGPGCFAVTLYYRSPEPPRFKAMHGYRRRDVLSKGEKLARMHGEHDAREAVFAVRELARTSPRRAPKRDQTCMCGGRVVRVGQINGGGSTFCLSCGTVF